MLYSGSIKALLKYSDVYIHIYIQSMIHGSLLLLLSVPAIHRVEGLKLLLHGALSYHCMRP